MGESQTPRPGTICRTNLTVLLLAGILLAGCGGPPKERTLAPEDRELQLQSFDQVWSTIQRKHWDPNYNGVNWDSVQSVLRPRMESVRTASEARGILLQMVGTLRQSHFGIYPRDLYEEVEGSNRSGEGTTGIDLRVIGGKALVVGVEPGSSAEKSGVKTGWEILGVGSDEIPRVLAKVSSGLKGESSRELLMAQALGWRLQGKVGETLAVRFLDGKDQTVDVPLVLEPPKGSRVQLGELPALYVWMDTTRVTPRVGLIRFNVFLDPANLMETFNRAVGSWMGLDGIIIDLRGNPGGLGAMAMGMAGWFESEKGKLLGIMSTRRDQVKFAVTPRATVFSGRVAILVDELSASTSEIFAAGMKDLGRARLFGSRTAGAALPSIFERLPNGEGFQYAFAGYVSMNGLVLEKNGVAPDSAIAPTRESLLEGHDPALEAAVSWIQGRPGTD